MQKKDLKYGNVVETRYGDRYIYIEYFKNDLIDLNGKNQVSLDYYKENLIRKYDSEIDRNLDIMKVYKDYTLQELLWERKEKKEELLTQEEKDYLKAIIKHFISNKIIVKRYDNFINIILSDKQDSIPFPRLENMTLKFNGLEKYEEYTLKELGLED